MKTMLEAMGGISDEFILEAVNVPRARRSLPKKAAAVLMAAAMCLLLAVGGFAAARIWNEELADYLGADEKRIEDLDGAAAYPEISLSANGVTVTVLQTLADSRGVYVLYEVLAPEGFEFDDMIHWGYNSLVVPKEEGAITGLEGTKILKNEGNKRIAMAHYFSDVPLRDGKMSLYLYNLCRAEDSPDWPVLIEGVWQLEWDFVYEDSSLLLCENEALGNRTIEELRISPMSIFLCMGDEEGIPDLAIKLRSGEAMEIKYYSTTYAGGSCHVYYPFPELMDLDAVLGVEVGGKEFPLK